MKYPLVFSDFDGTLTDAQGHLSGDFFEVLKILKQKERELVIITGRSVTWGYFFLSHFPLTACITEGGGVISVRDEQGVIRDEVMVSDDEVMRLNEFAIRLAQSELCPFLSADSYGRKTDQALEINHMSTKEQELAKTMIEEAGLHWNQSNVHLNFWSGEITKYETALRFLQGHRPEVNIQDCLFFGDSLNDQSMFQFMEHTVGVSNIEGVLNQMHYPPKEILRGSDQSHVKGVLHYLRQTFS